MSYRLHPIEPNVRKIAILRVNALGDLIVVLPALEALRTAYREAEIVLLGAEWHRRFLDGRPGPVDRVVVVPPIRGVTRTADYEDDRDEVEAFFEQMVAEHFDLALQILGGGRYSNPFVRRLGARLTVGSKAPDAPPLDRSVPYLLYQNEVWRYLEVVALVGAAPTVFVPRLAVTASDLAEARRAVPEGGAPLVALHPGASDPRRRWPPEKFAAVGDALARAGARVVATGTANEREIVAAVVEAMEAQARNLCDRLSLGGLAGLLSRCQVVVSNDTGPLHVAEAVGTATAGIYWCGNLLTAGPLTRSYHRPAISWRLECPVCGLDCTRARCEHADSFVADVPVEEVRDHALELLATRPDD